VIFSCARNRIRCGSSPPFLPKTIIYPKTIFFSLLVSAVVICAKTANAAIMGQTAKNLSTKQALYQNPSKNWPGPVEQASKFISLAYYTFFLSSVCPTNLVFYLVNALLC
jgi:hypothetical protein